MIEEPVTAASGRKAVATGAVAGAEPRELQVDDVRLPLNIRSERRRDARATIGRSGISIRLPLVLTDAERARHLTALCRWAERTVRRDPERYRIRPPRTYHDGQRLTIAGTPFVLRIANRPRAASTARLAAGPRAGCQLIDIELARSVHRESADRRKTLARLVSRMVGQALLPTVQSRLQALNAAHFRRSVGKVSMRFTVSRWGSCSTNGNISISTRLLLAPEPVRDYVLVHELAHLVEPNHSSRFWHQVERAMPDYARSEAWLKRHAQDCQF